MKLKTWEVIKALTENPKLRFRNNSHSYVQINNEDGSIVWSNKDGSSVGPNLDRFILYSNGPCCDNLHIEWEIVHQEVTWQEAIQAWVDGKEVYFTLNGSVQLYLDDGSQYLRTLAGCKTISKDEISKGNWFIK